MRTREETLKNVLIYYTNSVTEELLKTIKNVQILSKAIKLSEGLDLTTSKKDEAIKAMVNSIENKFAYIDTLKAIIKDKNYYIEKGILPAVFINDVEEFFQGSIFKQSYNMLYNFYIEHKSVTISNNDKTIN